MAQDWAIKFYKSKAWRNARRDAVATTGGLCKWCLDKGQIVPAEEVHHLVELTPSNIHDPDIALNPDLLVPLCHQCHDTTKRQRQHQPRYKISSDGTVITDDNPPS